MLYDLFIGCSAGITQVIVGHPFDTAKVLLQNQAKLERINVERLLSWRVFGITKCNNKKFNSNASIRFSNKIYR